MSASPPVAIVTARLAVLAERLPEALAGDVTGVHQARVASRRLREAVPVAGAAMRPSRVRQAIRRLRRITAWLGPVRELDVTLGLIDRLAVRHPDLRTTLEAVRGRVAGARELQRAHLVSRLDGHAAARLLGRMERFAARAAASPDSLAWRLALARRVDARADVVRRAVEQVGLLYDPFRLHDVRIAVKKLRYALEFAGEARLAPTARLVSRLKKVQDTLGDLHDLEVLDAFGKSTAGSPEHEIARADFTALHDRLQADCRAIHARYLKARARLVAVADDARDHVAMRVAASEPPTVVESVADEGMS